MRRGLTAINGVIALIVLLLIVQVWLLSATLDAFLAGHRGAALPAAAVSGVLFLACGALYLFVDRLDASPQQEDARRDGQNSERHPGFGVLPK